jgi:protein-export membrane protein SecD
VFILSIIVIFFLKKVYYKIIIAPNGKIVKILPANSKINLSWTDYQIEVKSEWKIGLDGWKYFRKGLDVAWWVRLTYKIDFSKYNEIYKDSPVELASIKRKVLEIIKRNIENRISKLWVADYSIRTLLIQWQYYLQVEIGGISDIDYAKSIIGKTVELEFMLPFSWSLTKDIVLQRRKLAENILKQIVNSGVSMEKFVDLKLITAPLKTQLEYNNWKALIFASFTWWNLPGFIKADLNDILKLWTWKVVPKLYSWYLLTWWWWWFIVKYLWKEKIWSGNNLSGNVRYDFEMLFIANKPYWVIAKDPKTWEILNGAYFKFASAQRSQNWQWAVVINFNDKWKDIFCHITEQNVWKQNAIFIWWKLITAPVINEPICGWSAQISWRFTPKQAKKLAKDLNEWALPAKLILVHEEKISPLLGESALKWVVIAGVVWFVLIAIMLLIMYNWRWSLIAIFSLIEFIVVTLAIVKLIDYALSLAWLSAIVLTIGMGVDANILMYERIREELKAWKSFYLAVIDWIKRSWNAIRDGNGTTFMIAAILFLMWMNIFKWFGFMMMLSIIIVLTVIVPLTKELLLKYWDITHKDEK